MNAMPIDSMFRDEEKNINLMLFNEIDNFIEVYNNSVIIQGPRIWNRIKKELKCCKTIGNFKRFIQN